METARIQTKIKLLFEKISEPNYVMNSYYMDSFINKLSDASDPDSTTLLASPLLSDLLVDALEDVTKYHNTVNVFLGRILAVVCKNEHHFYTKIYRKRRDKLLEFLGNITSKTMNPSLKVAYLELALTLTSHRTGVCWLVETEIWRKILSLYDKASTVFVLRLMYKFTAEFVWKLNDFDEDNSLNAVMDYILQPLLQLNFINDVVITSEEEEEIINRFEPILQMLLSVFSQGDRICYENKIARLLLKEQHITTQLYILFDRIRRENLILLLGKTLFYIIFLKTFETKPNSPGVVYTQEDFMEVIVMYFNMIHFIIQRRSTTLVLDYSGSCNVIWRSMGRNITLAPKQDNGRAVPDPQVKVLMIYLVPILVYVKSSNKVRTVPDEYIAEYMCKFVNMSCEHTTRVAYALRDLILEMDTLNVTLQSVKRLTCIKDHLTDGQANVVFQALFFTMIEYDPVDMCSNVLKHKEEDDYENEERKMLVMTYIVDTLLSIVKNYNINWQESLEVLCLNTVIHDILTKKTNLTCKFVVAALNLLAVTVSKFLPPNLSLLMESQPGSAMHEIGSLIFTKMHDMHWEVRDSALELLNVCTEISFIKFPPLQKQLIANNLINVAMTMALNDHEPYVQVSALRCVASASRVAPLWDHMKTDHPNLMEQLIGLLRNNQEGIVRKEACNVLCEVYQSVKLSPAYKQTLYEHMASSAMCDFHWEVQMSALKFWRIVIQSFLTDQGMLDGTFPPVTFSRETRKIVTLNEAEVRKRLLKVLDELAPIGCLTVLTKVLHDDSEVEVMEAAFTVAEELQAMLQQYKVSEHVRQVEGDPATMDELTAYIKQETETSQDEEMIESECSKKAENVIEGILKSDDMNLLASIYQKGMRLENEEPVTPELRLKKTASPYLFVKFMENTDCKKIIESKRNWKVGIRSISSLLDDVLGLYETNEECNSLDCY